ncbi:MAG: hypothetical protein BAA04_02570 [Firmicutes bacterium ZCTH02-B6]|nr:MAG: hypothetical protein BAA04_02570 [Firmicutes bacterium ZCTH02-B6]
MAINGRVYDWESINIHLPHGEVIGVQDIEYGDKFGHERVYGKGSLPIGYGRGNYEAEGKVTLLRDEYDKLVEHAKNVEGGFYAMEPFPITVAYANKDDEVKSVTLPDCIWVERKNSASQGATSLTVELNFLILSPIEEDGLKAYAPRR